MGNNMAGGRSKAAKIMKMNGEIFKLKIPSKASDAIKDYPDHVLLDSEEFLRFKLRAKPLEPEDELKRRKLYLLVQLPKLPGYDCQRPLRKARSAALETTTTSRDKMVMKKEYRRSVSDGHMIRNRPTAADIDDIYGSSSSHVRPTQVKIRLPKDQVLRIIEEDGDDNLEAARKVISLSLKEGNVVASGELAVVEEEENEEVNMKGRCWNVYGLCGLPYSYRRKYKRLTS